LAQVFDFKYQAFLSYSHRDKRWGKWLHGSLENYRIDRDLVGRETRCGIVPKSLRPIFRDREDFSAGHSLTDQTLAALEASQSLVVVCSPHAAQSEYVNEEVRWFKALGRADRVIPVIVDGDPSNPELDCFPSALRFAVGPDGSLSGERHDPIAADARPEGDGKEIAKLKVVAGLLGLAQDEIVRRAQKARRRRNHFWGALAGIFLFLSVTAAGMAVYAWNQLRTNQAFLKATLDTATGIVSSAVAQAEKYHVPRTATIELLRQAEVLFENMGRYGSPTPELLFQKASMLMEFARNYAILGDTNRQFQISTDAFQLLVKLTDDKPDDLTYQRHLSIALGEVCEVLVTRGSLPEALSAARQSLAISKRLAEIDPDNAQWQDDLAISYDRAGDTILVADGYTEEALKFFQDSLAIRVRLTTAEPTNSRWQHALSVSYNDAGKALRAQGQVAEAVAAFQSSIVIRQKLAKGNVNNLQVQRDLSVSYANIGEAFLARGQMTEALRAFWDSVTILERLAQSDESNTGWQRDLMKAQANIGDVLMAQGNLDEALISFRKGLVIAKQLARTDSENIRWRSDLSMMYEKIGDTLRAQNNFDEAITAFRDGLTISERVAQTAPNNIALQLELFSFHKNIAHSLEAQGNLTEALANCRESIGIIEKLTNIGPKFQELLAMTHGVAATLHRGMGNRLEALSELRKGRLIIATLLGEGPESEERRRDLASFDGDIAALEFELRSPQ
jgi:tetratricopeptide (TPR) repeat protein